MGIVSWKEAIERSSVKLNYLSCAISTVAIMSSWFDFVNIFNFLLWIQTVRPMTMLNNPGESGSDSDITNLLESKGYLPNENEMPDPSIYQHAEDDAFYLLSKLPDEKLVKLLNEQPKKLEYNLNDIVNLAINPKYSQDYKSNFNEQRSKSYKTLSNDLKNQINNNRFRSVSGNKDPSTAYFKLDDKKVEPFNAHNDLDPKYSALQKLNNLLYSRPEQQNTDSKIMFDEDDEKKELLFDVLVSQLKTLCCKRSKITTKKGLSNNQLKSLIKRLMPRDIIEKPVFLNNDPIKKVADLTKEHIFLIINDEIKSNGSEELISVDPESLENNSTVLLLGPMTTPLSDIQLITVMNRITIELSRPEYLPLLQELSEGKLSSNNIRLMKSIVSGPETRRYIKPHRCNHQSRLSKIYGGPKWIICTGYLNLNTPSLYD